MYVLTPEAMRAADADAIAVGGAEALMRAAGERVAERVRALVAPGEHVVAFAGPGNNGGDAFAALAELAGAYRCTLYAEPRDDVSPARRTAEERAACAGVRRVPLPTDDAAARAALADAALALDGLFGTGSRLPLEAGYRAATRALDARVLPVLAIDIPSGIDAGSGAVDPDAVRATLTLTLGAAKPGLLLEPARAHVGSLWCARIGIDDATLAAHAGEFAALDAGAFLDLLPRRATTADKRAAGAPLVIAGSAQFPGAAVLCARAAARAGAGYVTVATPKAAAATLRAHLVEQVVVELDDAAPPEAVAAELVALSSHNGAVAIGPGLGLDERTGAIVRAFLRQNELPCVVDASALFHLSKHLDVLGGKRCVVTPHAGEFARLSGGGTIAAGTRVARLRAFVTRTGIPTLLKGLDTLIDDGATMHVNLTGTSALATAGSGDVLTGIVATLLAQGLAPVDAARAGAFWHGLAGQTAAAQRCVGVVAGDVIDALAAALPTPPAGWLEQRLFAADA